MSEVDVSIDVTPDVSADAPSDAPVEQGAAESSGDDEAEYKAALAKARGEKAPKDETYEQAMERVKKKAKPEPEEDEDTPEPKIDSKAENKPVAERKDEGAPQVWKLKVNGSEVEFDASDEGRVKQAVQKGLAADAKFQEAAQVRQQAEGFIRALKENPLEVLQHPSLGIDFRKIAEDYLFEQIQREAAPEEYARTQERKELERYRAEEARKKQEAEQRQREEMKEQYRQNYTKQFTEALEEGGVPKTDWTIQRTALYMKQAIAKGYKHITPKDVIPMVKQDWINAQRQLFEHLDGEKLIEAVGQDVADKIRKANLARMQQAKAAKQPQAAPKSKEPEKVYRSTEELMRALQGS